MACGCGTTEKKPKTVGEFKAAIAKKQEYLGTISPVYSPLTTARTKRQIRSLKAGLTRLRNKRRLVAA